MILVDEARAAADPKHLAVEGGQGSALTIGRNATRFAGALVGGLGKGLVGVVTKPLAGAADLVAFAGMGFMHGMGAGWSVAPPAARLGR